MPSGSSEDGGKTFDLVVFSNAEAKGRFAEFTDGHGLWPEECPYPTAYSFSPERDLPTEESGSESSRRGTNAACT